jgi:hypothetical protein
MQTRTDYRTHRWVGIVTSVALLGLIVTITGLQSARVRGHIPFLHHSVQSYQPTGVVLSLGQEPGAQPTSPVVATTAVAVVAPTAEPAATVAPTLAPTATAEPAIVAAAATTAPATANTLAATSIPTAIPSPTSMPATATAAPTTAPAPLPPAVFLQPMSHWFQGWNQCAEESSAMALSYFGINLDPNAVTAILRPNNGIKGSKNVEAPRIVDFLHTQGVKADWYQGGTDERVKRLVAAGVPVIVGQWQNRGDHAGVGHWRVVRGYDDAKGIFVINDSMEGAAVPISYSEFDDLWPVYSYVYIPVWNDKLDASVHKIMGDEMDRKTNIASATAYIQGRIEQQPTNAELYFALGGVQYQAGNYQKAVDLYHKATSMGLVQKYPWTLWYESWPVPALAAVGLQDEALQVAQQNIQSAGVYSIMHVERAKIFETRGDAATAKREYQMALVDDKNNAIAQASLKRLGG